MQNEGDLLVGREKMLPFVVPMEIKKCEEKNCYSET